MIYIYIYYIILFYREDQYTLLNKDLECEQLCDMIKMLIIFSKEEENLKKIFESVN